MADADVQAPSTLGGRQLVMRMWWCVLAGTLIFTAFPFRTVAASNIWIFAWFALVPLMVALEDTTPKQAFWLGWLAGTVTNYGGFHWISGMLEDFGGFPPWLAQIGTVVLNAYQGLAIAIICSLWVRLRPRDGQGNAQEMSILRTAMIFTAVEFLFPMIFPWFFGNSQYRTLPAIQIADLTGVPGITFVMVACNAALYRALRRYTHKETSGPSSWAAIGVGLGLTAVTLGYGALRLSQVADDVAAADTLKIGLVEADVGIWSQEARANPTIPPLELRHSHLLRYHRLSAKLAAENVDLILWPESSYQPLDRVHIKRRPDFMLLATAEGQLAVWRDGRDPDAKGKPTPELATDMKWTMLPTDGALGTLRAVASEREDAAAIVGDDGVALYFDGKAVTRIPTSTQERLNGVDLVPSRRIPSRTANASTTIWAVGDNGVMLRGRRKRMDRVSSGTTKHLRDIAMLTETSGLAVGDGGTVVVLANGQARLSASPVSSDLLAVWAAPPMTADLMVYGVGAQGTVVKLGTNTIVQESAPTKATLRAIDGTDEGDLIVAVGDGGVAIVRDATGRWSVEQVGTEQLVAVAVDAFSRVVAADVHGGLYLRKSGGWSKLDAPGIVKPVGLAALGWIRHIARLPRDIRYMRPSAARIPPTDAAFFDAPEQEWDLLEWERAAIQRSHTTPILFGGITSELRTPPDPKWPYRDWNTAVMVDDDGRVVGLYDKVYLLVGGEFIPFGEDFPVVYEWIQHAGRFEAGNEVKIFNWRGYRLGVMICYEDILPKFNRRLADLEPHVILNVTNDAWFGKTAEPYLHMALAVFRTVEQRRALLRSTNTGVSVVIGPDGGIIKQTEITGRETLAADVPMMTGKTLYGRIGDVFAWVMVGWLLALVLPRMLAWRRRRKDSGKPPKKKKARAKAPEPASDPPPAATAKAPKKKSNKKKKRK